MKESLPDPDMQHATAALIRAAKRARQIAAQTATTIVVVRDGKRIREFPTQHDEPALKEERRLNN